MNEEIQKTLRSLASIATDLLAYRSLLVMLCSRKLYFLSAPWDTLLTGEHLPLSEVLGTNAAGLRFSRATWITNPLGKAPKITWYLMMTLPGLKHFLILFWCTFLPLFQSCSVFFFLSFCMQLWNDFVSVCSALSYALPCLAKGFLWFYTTMSCGLFVGFFGVYLHF